MAPRTLLRPVALLMACAAVPALADEVTVETARGPVSVETRPETVVVLDNAAIDSLEALGVSIAAVPAPNYIDYLADVADKAEVAGTLFEPDFEKLAIMGPDLIIAGGRSAAKVPALDKLAPTLDMTMPGVDTLTATKDHLATYGAIFGAEDTAADLATALDQKVSEARAAVADKGDALIVLTNGGKISAYGANSRFGWLHGALELPEAHPGLTAEAHGHAISFEFLAETDPDWLLVIDRGAAIGAEGEAAAATLDNPIVARTKAAQQGHIVYLDAGPLYIAGGGAGSMIHTLDEIVAAFSQSES